MTTTTTHHDDEPTGPTHWGRRPGLRGAVAALLAVAAVATGLALATPTTSAAEDRPLPERVPAGSIVAPYTAHVFEHQYTRVNDSGYTTAHCSATLYLTWDPAYVQRIQVRPDDGERYAQLWRESTNVDPRTGVRTQRGSTALVQTWPWTVSYGGGIYPPYLPETPNRIDPGDQFAYFDPNYTLRGSGRTDSGDPASQCSPAAKAERKATLLSYVDEKYWWTDGPLNNQPPLAAFQASVSKVTPRQVTFTNTSTDPESSVAQMTYTWDFGDGAGSTQRDPVHQYAEEGDYQVKLTARDASGLTHTATQTVEVGGPVLEGALFPYPTGDSVAKEGDALDVRLRVENDGDQDLTDVAVASVTVAPTDDEEAGLATIAPKPGGETLSGTLGIAATQTNLDFADYTVQAQEAGTVEVAAVVNAKEPDGTPVSATIRWSLEIRPAPLKVQLTAYVPDDDPDTPPPAPGTPLEFDLNENDHDNEFQVDVKLTNASDEPIDKLVIPEGDPIEKQSLRVDEQGIPILGVSLENTTSPMPTLADDELDPGEAVTLTYRFEGFDEAHATLSLIARGRQSDQAVSGRGTVDVKVLTDRLVEWGMKLDDRGGAAYLGGQTVRADGVLSNVSDEATVGVILWPTTDGNAGNGNVFATTDAGLGTPTTPKGFILAPGQDVDLRALLPTAELQVASDASASWEIQVWEHEVDEDTGELIKTRAPATQVKLLSDDGYSDRVTTRIAPTTPLPEVRGECAWAYIGCGILVGLERLAHGTLDFVRFAGNTLVDFGNQELRLIAWAGQMLGELASALTGDQAALNRIRDEIVLDMRSLIDAGAITYGQTEDLTVAVGQALAQFIEKWDRIYRSGDLEQVTYEMGVMAGENPDMLLSVFVAGRAARKLFIEMVDDGPARKVMEKSLADRAATLDTRLAAAERDALAGGTPVTESKVFDAGTPVDRTMQTEYWGADPRDIQTLEYVADAQQVSITYGSRVREAMALIRSGQAWPSPRELGIKPIGEIDITYLGYPERRRGYSDLAAPPADLDVRYVNTLGDCCFHPGDDKVLAASKKWVAQRHPDLDEATAQRVASQLQTRFDEFYVSYERFVEFDAGGGLSYEVPVGAQLKSSYFWGGREAWKQVFDERNIRLTSIVEGEFKPRVEPEAYPAGDKFSLEAHVAWKATHEKARPYWEIAFDATGDGDFRPITGGVDILSVQNLDGTAILDPKKRAKVYEELQAAISMDNGELADFVAGGQSSQLRAYAESGEAAVSIGPGGEARATFFRENVAIRPDTPNAGKRLADASGDFLGLVGMPGPWRAKVVGIGSANVGSLFGKLKAFYELPLFFLPTSLERFVNGMTAAQAPKGFDADGANVRADGDGGLEVYDPGSGARTRQIVSREAGASRWVPVSLADALALGPDPDVLELAPQTSLLAGFAGERTIQVVEPDDLDVEPGSAWFRAGDRIVIDPGGPNEERATVAALGSLVLTAPLARDHQPGEMIVRELAFPTVQVPPTTTTTTTSTTTVPPTPTTPTTQPRPTAPTGPTTPAGPDGSTTTPGGAGGSGGGTGGASGGATGAGGGALPRTGTDPTTLLQLALVLVMGGAVLVVRRRRTAPSS